MDDTIKRAAVLHFETADSEESDSTTQHGAACPVGWHLMDLGDQALLLGEPSSQLVHPPANRFTGHDDHGIALN